MLERNGWTISGYTGDGRVELGKYSPAGEDFSICVDVENFPQAVAECAEGFDPDEHVEMWIQARYTGVAGVPASRVLVHDAEAIEEMLKELAEALAEEDGATDLSDCDEETKTAILKNGELLNRRESCGT